MYTSFMCFGEKMWLIELRIILNLSISTSPKQSPLLEKRLVFERAQDQ